jgi:hypothetical protein
MIWGGTKRNPVHGLSPLPILQTEGPGIAAKFITDSGRSREFPDFLRRLAEVNEEFDSKYDQGEFERKIAGVVRNIQRAPMPDKGEEPSWDKGTTVSSPENGFYPISSGGVQIEVEIGNNQVAAPLN